MYRNLPSWNVVARIGLIDLESCQQTTYYKTPKEKRKKKGLTVILPMLTSNIESMAVAPIQYITPSWMQNLNESHHFIVNVSLKLSSPMIRQQVVTHCHQRCHFVCHCQSFLHCLWTSLYSCFECIFYYLISNIHVFKGSA